MSGVLIIDVDPMRGFALMHSIANRGREAVHRTSLTEGVAALSEQRPLAVVLHLPVSLDDGRAIDALLTHPAGPEVVICTGTPEHRVAASEKVAWLVWPIEMDVLWRLLQRANP